MATSINSVFLTPCNTHKAVRSSQQSSVQTIHSHNVRKASRGLSLGNCRQQRLICRAEEGESAAPADDDFESKLAALKGSRRQGAGSKAAKRIAMKEGTDIALKESKMPDTSKMDFTNEVVWYEGKPSSADLAINIGLGTTLLWLPLTFAAVGRYLWLSYKFTDKRILIESTSPVETGTTQVVYSQVRKVVTVGRMLGLYGDMIITLKNGENVECRSIPGYKEIEGKIKAIVEDNETKEYANPKGF